MEVWDFGTIFQPYHEVGGDLIVTVRLAEGRVGVFVGDVAGKGVAAGILAVRVHEFWASEAPGFVNPREIVLALNDALNGEIPRGLFVVGVYAVADPQKREVTLLGCGHTAPLIYRGSGQKVESIRLSGAPLGLLNSSRLSEVLEPRTVRLFPEDRFLAFTDGLSETMNPEGREYGEVRLVQAFRRFGHLSSASFLDALARDLNAFRKDMPVADDLTVATFRFSAPVSGGNRPEGVSLERGDTDPLTGLPDGKALLSFSAQGEYSVAMIDLDRFSDINRRLGRAGADETLRKTAETVRKSLGEGGLVGRFAGDTFYAILPGKNSKQAREAAEGIRRHLQALSLSGEGRKLTASIGIAEYPFQGIDVEQVARRARLAAETSKRKGGDCITVADRVDAEAIEAAAVHEVGNSLLCGRGGEIILVEQALEEAEQGDGRFLLLSGEPGVGATRILDHIQGVALKRRVEVLRYVCPEPGRTEPYRTVTALLLELAKRYPAEHEIGLKTLAADGLGTLESEFPELTQGYRREGARPPKDPVERRRVLFVTLARLVMRWARVKGLCLILEHCRAMDRPSFELVRWLLTVRGFRATILMDLTGAPCSEREDEAAIRRYWLADLKHSVGVWELPLSTLGLRDLEEFMRSNLLSVTPAEPFLGAMMESTSGAPLRMIDWTRRLIRKGELKLRPPTWVSGENGFPACPDDPEWINEMDPDHREVMDLLAAAGGPWSTDFLAGVTDRNPLHLADVVGRLIREGILRTDGPAVRWASESRRRRRYATIPEQERRRLHARIARKLDETGASPFERLHHWERAGNEEKAGPLRPKVQELRERRFIEEEITQLRGLKPADELTRVRECTHPLTDEARQRAYGLIRQISSCVKVVRIYPEGAPPVRQALATLEQEIETFMLDTSGVTFTFDAEGISVNGGKPLGFRPDTAEGSLSRMLKEKLVRSVTLLAEVPREEIVGLVNLFAEQSDPYEIAASEDYWQARLDRAGYTRVGITQVAFEREGEGERATDDAEALRRISVDLKSFFKSICGAVEAVRVYPKGSGVTRENVLSIHRTLTGLLKGRPGISLGVVGKGLVLNGMAADSAKFGSATDEVASMMAARGIRELSFAAGVRPEEIETLVDVLGSTSVMGEEEIMKVLDRNGVQRIAVGRRAYRFKHFGAATGGEKKHGPIEQAEKWIESGEEFLLHPETIKQLVPVLNGVTAAGRSDLTCRLVKRYVRILEDGRQAEEVRARAARAVTDAMLRGSLKARKIAIATAQEAVLRIMAAEPGGPISGALEPVSLLLVSDEIDRGRWKVVYEKLESVRRGPSGNERLNRLLDALEAAGKLQPILDAYHKGPEGGVELLVPLLGKRAANTLVGVIRESEEPERRKIAARILRRADPDGWKRLLVGLGGSTPAAECIRVIEALSIVLEDPGKAGMALVSLVEHPNPEVAEKVLSVAGSMRAVAATEVARRAIRRGEDELVVRGLNLASEKRLEDLGAAVYDLVRRSDREKILEACCRYFERIPLRMAQGEIIRLATERKGILFRRKPVHAEAVRIAAVRALGAFGTNAAREALKVAAKDRSPVVRAAAEKALGSRE